MTNAKLATISLATALLSWASNPSPASALTSPEIGCRDAIAKTEAKYTKTAFSALARCHEDRSSGDRSLGDDCNDVSEADNRGQLAKARAKATAKITAACGGAASLLPLYPACPAPAASVDNGGATTGIDDFNELSTCLLALIDAGTGAASLEAMGTPDERLLDAVIDCQQSLGRGVVGLMRARLAEGRKCQHEVDSNGGGTEYLCDGVDSDGKIARAQGYLGDLVFRDCDSIPQQELMKLNACSDTAAGLADCAQAIGDAQGAEIIHNAYELADAPATTTTSTTSTTMAAACGDTFPTCGGDCAAGTFCENTGVQCECVVPSGPCAPATILRRVNARYAGGQSQLSTGWTGKTHVVDLPDNSFDAIDVTCDGNCENCDVSLNVAPAIPNPPGNCRCNSAPSTTCNAINGVDPDNCGALTPSCDCYFGPPLAISSGGTPVCVLNQLREDYSGSMDLRTGNYSDIIKLASLVHLGVSQFAPCPTCEGDATPYDDVRDGTCDGGLQNGQPCDVDGDHISFGDVSFDCPPASASNISGAGLQIDLRFQSGTQSLTAALPCDASTVPGALCPCRVCTDAPNPGCTSNADCAAAGAGECTGGGNIPIEPNDCTDGVCSSAGLCEAGPVDEFCDGAVHADGRGFVSCNTNADCIALDAGSCTVLDLRRCFPDPIVVTGSSSIANPVNGTIFCIPPTTNDPVNLTAGLPGPGTANLDFAADVRCQSDPSVVYDFPDGANCPNSVTTTTSTTSTTLPLPSCGGATFPVCAGTCPGTMVCTPSVSTCACTGQ